MAASFKASALFGKLMERNKAILNCNPELNYMSFDHITQERKTHGSLSEIIAREGNMFFDCKADVILRKKGSLQRNTIEIHYITDVRQSAKLTTIEMDLMVKCYSNEDIELESATTVIRPMRDPDFNLLVQNGTVTVGRANVWVKFITKQFEMTL